ncbi:unannotated protein [freshwater metagenome]|uniref:Unannotated protein n=1 Tax=freshwater metagenome TaxID=449393 RepID=A0A6J7HYT6_9ZZZZ
MRHSMRAQERRHLVAVDHIRRSDDQCRPGPERQYQLEDRSIEVDRVAVQHSRIDRNTVSSNNLLSERVYALMRHHNGFRCSRGPRGVDDVRRVCRCQRAETLFVGQRLVAERLRIALGEPLDACFGSAETNGNSMDHLLTSDGRILRIDRHERATGLHDRPQRHDVLDRAFERQGNKSFRTDTVGNQEPRHPVGSAVELRVRDSFDAIDRHSIEPRIAAQYVEQRSARHLGRQLRHGGKSEISDDEFGVRDPRAQNFQNHRGELYDGVPLVQVHCILDLTFDAVRFDMADDGFGEHEVEVELGSSSGDRQHRDGQILHRSVRRVVERQHHLKHRMAVQRPSGFDRIYDALERKLGVSEGVEVSSANCIEQLHEARRRIDGDCEGNGSDEHADHLVERLVTSACGRGADDGSVRPIESAQSGGHCGVENHECGRVGGTRQFTNGRVQVGFDHERNVGGDHGLRRGPREVRWYRRQSGAGSVDSSVLQDRGPVLQLLVRERVDDRPIPHCVLAVLSGQPRPCRRMTCTAGSVRDGEVADEWVDRPTVDRNVVDHYHHHRVAGLFDGEKCCADRHFGRHIESIGRELGYDGVEPQLGSRLSGNIGEDVVGGSDYLLRSLAAIRKIRPQRFVTFDDVAKSGQYQRGIVSMQEPYGHGHVVCR